MAGKDFVYFNQRRGSRKATLGKAILYYYKNEIILLLFLLPFLWITGLQSNHLSSELLFREIETEGVNYDVFREFRIGEDVLTRARENTEGLYDKYPELKKYQIITPIDYITFSMFANSFDLRDGKLTDSAVLLKGYKRVTGLGSYKKLREYYYAILNDIERFPVPRMLAEEEDITYVDSWSEPRSYGGKRKHEGTDIMAGINERGHYPVISMTDGQVEKMGWLEQGGYRIGVRSPSGGYFYYAHLSSYAPDLKEGDKVYAGQLLGFMGDSGYGEEGTVGKFDVHLHVGIYVNTKAGEMSVNPYYILKILEKDRTSFMGYPSN